MRVPQETLNLQTYRTPEVASHYAALDYLTPCEQLLFRTYIKPGMAVLDLGVGGGRTTPYLSSVASRYVGVDYSEAMVGACRKKFPNLDFVLADASDLSTFDDASFDAIVFAFNGLDYVVPDEKRSQCLRECRRVLCDGGILIFSSHNPRAIFVRPDWDERRVRAFAERFVSQPNACFPLVVGAATVVKAVHALARALARSAVRLVLQVPQPAFWHGEGNVLDSVHGGLVTHCWVPERVIAELATFDFQLTTFMGDDYPRVSRTFLTDWYYFAFAKDDCRSRSRQFCA
jgi:ubiquinone/menaquinone biosynthesis C-methylase UbiE